MRVQCVLTCLLVLALPSQASVDTSQLKVLVADQLLHGAGVSVAIGDSRSNTQQFIHNETQRLVPASVTKLFTTAAALQHLGPNFKYHTGFFLDGIIDVNGTLRGNVFVKGNGDPTLGDSLFPEQHHAMRHFVDSLQYLGITELQGNIIVDDTYFGIEPFARGWAWDDLQYSYAAQVNGLNFRNNSVRVSVTCKPGKLASVDIQPDGSGMLYELKTDENSDKVHISRELNSTVITITVPESVETALVEQELISVPDASSYFLSVFSHTLDRAGIVHKGALVTASEWETTIAYEEYTQLFSYPSPPLQDIVKVVNHESHNLAADCLALTLVREKTGTCSWDSITPIFKDILSATETDFELFDGSGLSRMNSVSAQDVVRVLSNMQLGEHFQAFYSSLAAPGQGTLKYRLRDANAGEIRAKTGSMTATSCLAGYFTPASKTDNTPVPFCILMNNVSAPLSKARMLQDLMCLSLF